MKKLSIILALLLGVALSSSFWILKSHCNSLYCQFDNGSLHWGKQFDYTYVSLTFYTKNYQRYDDYTLFSNYLRLQHGWCNGDGPANCDSKLLINWWDGK